MGRDHSDCVISHCLTKTSPPILQYTVLHSGWSGTCENHKGWTKIGLPQQTGYIVGLMLGHRRGRWISINPT